MSIANDKLPAKWIHICTGETEITIYEPGDEVPPVTEPTIDPILEPQ